MIYAYAQFVPNEKVFPIVQKYVQQYGTSQNEHERAAAVHILGYISDSDACLDPIKENIDALTVFIIARMSDESFNVREAAGETVGRFSEHVNPEFLDKHKQIMPCLLRVIQEL